MVKRSLIAWYALPDKKPHQSIQPSVYLENVWNACDCLPGVTARKARQRTLLRRGECAKHRTNKDLEI